jgi:hypothetical protein
MGSWIQSILTSWLKVMAIRKYAGCSFAVTKPKKRKCQKIDGKLDIK